MMAILVAAAVGGFAFALIIIWETRHERRSPAILKGKSAAPAN